MSSKPRFWLVISLLCLFGALVFWELGNRWAAKQESATPAPVLKKSGLSNNQAAALLSAPRPMLAYASTNLFSEPAKSRHPLRLHNSPTSLQELSHNDSGLLLANAVFDTRWPMALSVPEALQLKGKTESYVVQSRGKASDAFRSLLTGSGAEIVSYVPNNAYLVRIAESAATQLQTSPLVQSVIPWIPYFKLAPGLLEPAVAQKSVPADSLVRLLVYPRQLEAALAELRRVGAVIVSQNRSPFGTQIGLRLPSGSVLSLAQIETVEWIEPYVQPAIANDLTGTVLHTSTNSGPNTEYLGLTGYNNSAAEGVRVNLNDTGVDDSHPDLAPRIVGGDPSAHADIDGHGTHVAGIIASSGKNTPVFTTNAPSGSATNADFHGKAPKAVIMPYSIDQFLGSIQSDVFLQESAARDNAPISNNSWGYIGISEYDSAAASYDAAVRDALPQQSGEQSIAYVFAAGNSGQGGSRGLGGDPDSISSPATAKNVITVGSLESFRKISGGPITTNIFGETRTNSFFLSDTDSDKEVSDFSSRGNVGIGIEGDFGRFKPDVVAPGSYIISTRSKDWTDPSELFSYEQTSARGQRIEALSTNFYQLDVPDNTVQITLRTAPNTKTFLPMPALEIGLRLGDLPPPSSGSGFNYLRYPVPAGDQGAGTWFISVANTNTQPVAYDILVVLKIKNDTVESDFFTELKALNDGVGPFYRYESGTSMAAPAISGMIAQLYDFFTNVLVRPYPSPALTKALLINGTVRVDTKYDRHVKSPINLQGWGRADLRRIIPEGWFGTNFPTTFPIAGPLTLPLTGPVTFYDQKENPSLATGESWTRVVNFDTNNASGQGASFNLTLVWTDPPGNPAVGIKLVNDLDLIVTNLVTHEVYWGNNIASGSVVSDSTETNAPPVDDVVNNVENVFLPGPQSAAYSVTVVAKRVNVNAVTSHPDGVVQDYALVIGSGDPTTTAIWTIVEPVGALVKSGPALKELTNGVPLLSERVGANSPLLVDTNGEKSHWNFYKFVNVGNTNPYVAILTFQPPNLSKSRLAEADIDLYVSDDAGLLTLDPNVLAKAIAQGQVSGDNLNGSSRSRVGSEFVAFSNSPPGQVYYIAIKSEDQQSAEFGLIAIATDEPFDKLGKDGCVRVRFLPTPVAIPDGSNDKPGGFFGVGPAIFFGISTRASLVRNIVVTNVIQHEDFGDLTGILKGPNGVEATLFSHTFRTQPANTLLNLVFDDSGTNRNPGVYESEGPIKLRYLSGGAINGVWQLAIFDNALFHTGRVERASLCLQPQNPKCFTTEGCVISVLGESWYYDFIDIPFDATKLQVCVSENTSPLEVYLKRGIDRPTREDWDAFEVIDAGPGGCLTLDGSSSPPLIPGRYQLGIFNPSAIAQNFRLRILITRGLLSDSYVYNVSTNAPLSLTDDAVSTSSIYLQTNRIIVDARVGVRINHPRVSDLSLHLISPSGTRWLLGENRGGTSPAGFGFTFGLDGLIGSPDQILTNYSWVTFSDSTNLSSGPLKFISAPFKNPSLLRQPVILNSDLEIALVGGYPQGAVFESWHVLTNTVAVILDPYLSSGHSQVLALSEGAVQADLDIFGEKKYELSFAYRNQSSAQFQILTFPVGSMSTNPNLLQGTIAPAVRVEKLRVAPGQQVFLNVPPTQTVDVGSVPPVTAEGDKGPLPFRGLTRYALVGQWSYSSTNLATNNAWGAPFVVGTNWSGFAPSAPGDYYLWLTINDENYGNNTGSFDVTARWKPSQLDTFRLVLSGVTNVFFATDYWQTNTLGFIGREDDKRLAFFSDWNTTTLIDSVKVTEPISSAYYLGEEPLPTTIVFQADSVRSAVVEVPNIRGENAQGTWRLEIADSRTAPLGASPAPELLSWYLQVLFAPGQQPIPLTNCVPFTDLVRRSQIRYYEVRVPREAVRMTNYFQTLTGDSLNFYFNKDTLPDPDVDAVFTDDFGNGLILDVGPGPVDVAPGSVYYLAVKNFDPTTSSNRFQVQVDFGLPMLTLAHGVPAVPGLGNNFAAITNQFVITTNFLSVTNIEYPGTNMQWYKFVVDPSPTLTAAVFELHSTNRELHLVARRGLPEVAYLPTPTHYDYHSLNPDLTNEVIIVQSNAFPIPITATPWILGVYNSGTNAGFYQVTAMRWTNMPPQNLPLPRYTISTNWDSTTNEIGFALNPGEKLNFFYPFISDVSQTALLFEIYNLTGDVDLRVRRSDLPSTSLFDFSDFQTGTNSERVSMRTNVFLPTFGNPTNWFINLVNHDFLSVTGLLRVASATSTNALLSALPLSLDINVIASVSGISISWHSLAGERYEVQYSDLAMPVTWFSKGTFIADASQVTYTDPAPPAAGVPRYYRIIQLGN